MDRTLEVTVADAPGAREFWDTLFSVKDANGIDEIAAHFGWSGAQMEIFQARCRQIVRLVMSTSQESVERVLHEQYKMSMGDYFTMIEQPFMAEVVKQERELLDKMGTLGAAELLAISKLPVAIERMDEIVRMGNHKESIEATKVLATFAGIDKKTNQANQSGATVNITISAAIPRPGFTIDQ